MKSSIIDIAFCVFVGFCVGFSLAAFFKELTIKELKQEAVARGVAEWKINLSDGFTTFTWKPIVKDEPRR